MTGSGPVRESDHAETASFATATGQWPTAPIYNFASDPIPVITLNASDLGTEVGNNFWRSARWCPDGSAILSSTEDRCLRVHRTTNEQSTRFTTHSYPQSDAVHSTLWYPAASALSAETYCFVASIRDTPVRLIDAGDGRIRASYPIVDHRERFIAPHALAFDPTSTKLYCGFENAIEVFDVGNPGYDTAERLKTAYTRKEKGGQKGIISALAFCPDYSGMFAAGSFSGTVSLYSEDTGATPVGHLDGVKGGGVTQTSFAPLNPQRVFVASRRSDEIQVFDLRNPLAPVEGLLRPGSTNQRLWFDVDPWGRWLSSGDQHGFVRVWDINHTEDGPIFEKKLHNDAVGSVQFHPYEPLLLTAAGSRAEESGFLERSECSEGTSSSDFSDSDEDDARDTAIWNSADLDCKLRIWSLKPSLAATGTE